jgi:hypothetical protein
MKILAVSALMKRNGYRKRTEIGTGRYSNVGVNEAFMAVRVYSVITQKTTV